jgi:serine protease AprX
MPIHRNFAIRSFAIASLLTLPHIPLAAQTNQKVSKDLVTLGTQGSVPVIIQYASEPGDNELATLNSLSANVHRRFSSIHSIHATVPLASLSTLSQSSNVSFISLDRPVTAKQASATSAEYTYEPVNAPAVWQKGFVGTGIGVAVIDSGINAVPDLSTFGFFGGSRIVYAQSFVPGDASTGDQYGHGTHVAGLIAGNGAQSTGPQYYRTFYGTAPNANLINLRVLDQDGVGSDSAVIAAIEQAVALKKQYNIKVINLSIGRPVYESFTQDPLDMAVERAWQAGITVVVAAGNDGRDTALNAEGYGTIEAPGNDPYVLTVGAVKTEGTASINDDQVASYSSKGPSFIDHLAKPDIIAPGNIVTSLKFANDPLASQSAFVTLNSFYERWGNLTAASNNYFPLSGTSMAAGVVSGSIADLIQARPEITPDQVKAFIMRNGNRKYLPATSVATDPTSGLSYTAHNDIFTVGAGYLDIAATVNNVLSTRTLPTGTAMSPVAAYDIASNSVFLLKFPYSIWGTTNGSTTWAATDVYGQNAFGGSTVSSKAVFGWTPLYGASNVTGQPINAATVDNSSLWGTTSVLAPNDPAAYTALWGNGTPLWGTGTPLWGTGTPYTSTGTPLWGTGTPLWGTTTPLWGTGTPLWGTGTPLWGTGTPLWGTSTPLWGTGTPLWGTATPLWGTGTPLWGTSTPLWGTSSFQATSTLWGEGTPLWGTGTPLWGTGTPLWGTGTPLWGTGTPLWGTGTPLWGTGTPLWGTGTPLWGTGTPLWGTGTPLWGTGTPLWGTGTPLWGTGTPLWGTGTPLWGTSAPFEE